MLSTENPLNAAELPSMICSLLRLTMVTGHGHEIHR